MESVIDVWLKAGVDMSVVKLAVQDEEYLIYGGGRARQLTVAWTYETEARLGPQKSRFWSGQHRDFYRSFKMDGRSTV